MEPHLSKTAALALVQCVAAAFLLGPASCSHTQSAPTPAPNGTTTTVTPAQRTSSASLGSRTEKPWTNPANSPSPVSVGDLSAPLEVAMVLCSSALNLAPCGVITTGPSDTMTCVVGCETQIKTVVAMTIEHAAHKCASAPPPEAGLRECTLEFPPTAALDPEVAGKTCNALCEEIASKTVSR